MLRWKAFVVGATGAGPVLRGFLMRPLPKEAPMRMRRPRKLSRPVDRSVSGAQSGSFSRASGHGTSRSAH